MWKFFSSYNFPLNQNYELLDSDGYIWEDLNWEVGAFIDENSDGVPNPEELQGKSGEFVISSAYTYAIDINLSFNFQPGHSLELDGSAVVETDFTDLDGGSEITFELYFKAFDPENSGGRFEFF